MILVDYVIISIVVFSVLTSLLRGFISEAISLITWACAFFAAGHYYTYFTIYFDNFEEHILQIAIPMVLLFAVTFIAGSIINYLVNLIVTRNSLSTIDRILGVFFGTIRGILVVSAIILFLNNFTKLSHSQSWQHSMLIPQLNHVISWFLSISKIETTYIV